MLEIAERIGARDGTVLDERFHRTIGDMTLNIITNRPGGLEEVSQAQLKVAIATGYSPMHRDDLQPMRSGRSRWWLLEGPEGWPDLSLWVYPAGEINPDGSVVPEGYVRVAITL